MLQQHAAYFVGELRHFYLFGKEAAIGIREGRELGLVISAALVGRRVKFGKEAYERHAHIFCGIVLHVVVKHITLAEDAGILSIEAEHKADTKNIKVT